MLILGIDPGYAIVGYGAVDYTYGRFSPVRFGAITTPAGMEFSARLEMIYQDMTALLDRTPVRALSIEKLFFTNNKTTAIEVAEARGVILLSARQHNVPVFEYTPMQVKQSVVGYGKAEKHQVMEMTRQLLGLSEVPRPDDTADALALAICHAHSANSLLTYLK
ncbi:MULTISPECIES: crossover junction endodeoxyribonuclease RuvC [Anaerotruncus]|uniref:crossover junction endodeoxyribonuclease RuvC n=1 Tax=Anaerotruncus TaxID=244127 RepID=UPI00082BF6BE|nr:MULTISPECIES: crossover junction endodeoxyribonuclease RuvC [Anaerotruncus]RGX54897.1 crossover junction endodeoxyribonuclease RuvC [Anaerotruncus sp. AF02-27]